MQKPLTPQQYEAKHGVPVITSANFKDPSVRASVGFETAAFAPTHPSFQSAEKAEQKRNRSISQKFTSLIGLGESVDVFSRHIANNPIGARLVGGDPANIDPTDRPSFREMSGAVAQTASTAVSPAIAPMSMPGMIATGAGLGYAYDVGADLISGSSVGKTMTPGVGTAVGAVAPPVIAGVFKGVSAGVASLIGRTAVKQVPRVTNPGAIDTAIEATKGAADSVASRANRIGKHVGDSVTDKANLARQLSQVPDYARPAVRAKVDREVIKLATEADDVTRDAMRRMVQMAEDKPSSRVGLRPTHVAEEAAIDQYRTIDTARKEIGARIGQLSDELPTGQNIDITPSLQKLDNVLAQNGIIRQSNGQFVFQNRAITPEQRKAIEALYNQASEVTTLSGRQIHQTDQLFSRLQRESRVISKIDDVKVQVPAADGQQNTVSIYKLFRDVFSQQLDELSPDMRAVNSEYRKLRNLIDDIEDGIVRSPKFESISNMDGFAESGLRQMLGEGVNTPQLQNLYNVMDDVSRSVGYSGPRADDLYYFGNQLRAIYPETIPTTGFRGGIGASIRDVLGTISRAGEVNPKDQQRAIRELLQLSEGSAPVSSANSSILGRVKEHIKNIPNKEGGFIANPLGKKTTETLSDIQPRLSTRNVAGMGKKVEDLDINAIRQNMSGDDMQKLEPYLKNLRDNKPMAFDEFKEATKTLEAMGMDVLNAPPQEQVRFLTDLLSKFEQGMKRIPVQ